VTFRSAILAWLAGAALAQFFAASTIRAQRPADVRGIVIDSVSGEPVARARVDLFEQLKTGPRILRAGALTDSAGRFRIEVAALASALVEVRQIGFAPRTIILDDARSRDTLIIALARTATSLGEVRVVEKGGRTQHQLEVSGFVDRRKIGIGKFLDSTRIERSNTTSLLSLLRPYLKSCTMIYVDGLPGRLGDVDIARVIGIEIYASNVEAPPLFHNRIESTGRCGSIVVWRRS
jgi:hypothetical protein